MFSLQNLSLFFHFQSSVSIQFINLEWLTVILYALSIAVIKDSWSTLCSLFQPHREGGVRLSVGCYHESLNKNVKFRSTEAILAGHISSVSPQLNPDCGAPSCYISNGKHYQADPAYAAAAPDNTCRASPMGCFPGAEVDTVHQHGVGQPRELRYKIQIKRAVSTTMLHAASSSWVPSTSPPRWGQVQPQQSNAHPHSSIPPCFAQHGRLSALH